jgi:prophage antirepressor-like protein
MDILKAFSLLDENHTINIQGTPENPLFQANQIGQLLGITNIHQNIQEFSEKERHLCLTYTPQGGTQKTTFLTENGLYKILGRSRKPIAAIFQNWVIDVIKEIRNNGIYQLKQENEIDRNLLTHNMLSRHSISLKESHDKKNLVYICKIKDDEENPDCFIIKIGSTQNIKQRLNNIAREYGIVEPFLLDVIPCDEHTKLENLIHNHETFKYYRYKTITKRDGHIATEVYLANEKLYANFLTIIKEIKYKMPNANIDKNIEYEKLIIEKEKLNIESEKFKIESEKHRKEAEELILRQKEADIRKMSIELEIEKLKNTMTYKENQEENNPDAESDNESESSVTAAPRKTVSHVTQRTNSIKVPKVYQYLPTDLKTPVHVYDSPMEIERKFDYIAQPSMRLAYQRNRIYKGFRWYYVKRDEEPPAEIPPTEEGKAKSTEIRFIAMIDVKKTKIMQVFATQKEATESRNMKCTGFTRAIQKQSISSGHYWNFFDACPIEWREEYLKTNQLPEKHVFVNGKTIQQIDPVSMRVLETFKSKRDVVRKFQVSYNKLGEVVNTETMYDGYFWREIENTREPETP